MIYLGNKPVGVALGLPTYENASNLAFIGVDFVSLGMPEVVINNSHQDGVKLGSCFNSATVEKVVIHAKAITDIQYGFQFNSEPAEHRLREIVFDVDTGYIQGSWLRALFYGRRGLVSISGVELDGSTSSNYSNMFGGCVALQEIRFRKSTFFGNLSMSACSALSDASLISIANGLNENYAMTITLHATPKARCTTLMGTNDNGTFVADESGTLSLVDFITTVKGWTVA